MILIANSYRGRGGNRGQEVKLRENLQNHTFSSYENALCDIERALQSGHFCSFAEKDSGLDPHDPPICAPEHCI